MKSYDSDHRHRRAARKGMDGEYFGIHNSKLHKILKNKLGPAANAYLIADGGTCPYRYQLGLSADTIAVEATMVEEGNGKSDDTL
ncbi:hypothetical protein [Candidatus Symbiobacter mobilis]|nr:hypothetical protein [Candidatus Symbiobacter mobilis]